LTGRTDILGHMMIYFGTVDITNLVVVAFVVGFALWAASLASYIWFRCDGPHEWTWHEDGEVCTVCGLVDSI